GCDVVQEGKRAGAVHQDVVHAVVHEILAHGVMDAGARRDQHLRADAVGREHQDRLFEPRRNAHHAGEGAELAQRQRGARGARQLADSPLGLLREIEAHPRRAVAIGHASPPPPAPPSSTSKWTSSLNARTRARTSAAVTCSSPWMPNASTANDPIAAPYTIARRRPARHPPPVHPRYAKKAPG